MTMHMTAHLLSPAGALLVGVAAWRVTRTVCGSTAWLIGQACRRIKPGEAA